MHPRISHQNKYSSSNMHPNTHIHSHTHTHTRSQYDLPKTQRQLTSEEMLKFSRDNGFIRFFETSVKDGTNINEALE